MGIPLLLIGNLDRWKARHLALKGKTIIVNSLILELPFHAHKNISKEWMTLYVDFIGMINRKKIKRDTIRSFKDMGGTGLLNIREKLQALKINILKRYTESSSKWRFLFDIWISKASGLNDRDLISCFSKTGGCFKIDLNCVNETREIPLWKNTIITGDDEKEIDSKILKPKCYTKLKHVEIGEINLINAGRIWYGLNKNINKDFVCECREGPANHISSKVFFEDCDNNFCELAKMSVKQNVSQSH